MPSARFMIYRCQKLKRPTEKPADLADQVETQTQPGSDSNQGHEAVDYLKSITKNGFNINTQTRHVYSPPFCVG